MTKIVKGPDGKFRPATEYGSPIDVDQLIELMRAGARAALAAHLEQVQEKTREDVARRVLEQMREESETWLKGHADHVDRVLEVAITSNLETLFGPNVRPLRILVCRECNARPFVFAVRFEVENLHVTVEQEGTVN